MANKSGKLVVLSTKVSVDVRYRFRTLARSRGMSVSRLLRLLVETAVRGSK